MGTGLRPTGMNRGRDGQELVATVSRILLLVSLVESLLG